MIPVRRKRGRSKIKTIQEQVETVASTEGQAQRPHAWSSYGGLYIPICDPNTPQTPHPNPPLTLHSFLGDALENRADEREYEGID